MPSFNPACYSRGHRQAEEAAGHLRWTPPSSLPALVCRVALELSTWGPLRAGFIKYVCVCVCIMWCVYVCVFPGRVEEMALRPRPEASLFVTVFGNHRQ